ARTMSAIRRVGVLGCGQMGGGIAQLCARSGYEVVVRELSEEALRRGLDAIRGRLEREVAKETLSAEERDAALGRLRGTTSLEELATCELLIEAVVEDLEVKNDLWRALDPLCPPETIFASNTSSLAISAMAGATGRPERVV